MKTSKVTSIDKLSAIGATQNIPVTPTILAKIIENNNKNTTLRMIESGIENIVSIRLL
jgi:hypothetical protein